MGCEFLDAYCFSFMLVPFKELEVAGVIDVPRQRVMEKWMFWCYAHDSRSDLDEVRVSDEREVDEFDYD